VFGVGVVTFLLFFPNPALPIGNAAGLQLGQVLAALIVPFLLITARARKEMATALMLILPLLISAGVWIISGTAEDQGLIAKSVTLQVLAMAPLPFAAIAIRRGLIRPIVLGAASALIVHSGFALHQFVAFRNGEFPFLFLFQNPSFLQPTEAYALWVRRITGLFPEPSALAAACGPWIVLIAGLLTDTRLFAALQLRRRIVTAAAVLLGIAVILISGSGYAILLFGLVGAVGVLPVVLAHRRVSKMQVLMGVMLVASAGALYWLGSETLQSRVQDVDSLSWGPRLRSMMLGLSALLETPQQMLFGVGPGLSFKWMGTAATTATGFGDAEILAVWSIHVRYISETGVLGLAGIVFSTGVLTATVSRSSQRLLGWTCLAAWLISGWITTSYFDLEPIWLFMGVLLTWDHLFPRAAAAVRMRVSAFARAA
jgi:hypothetical protein